jgi:acyl-coenzyme A synthetase/AMP-(fatty) acid ligase
MTPQAGDLNITDDIARWSVRGPSRPALIVEGRTIGYAALEALIVRGAGWLAGRGITTGTAVTVCIADPVKHLIVALGLARIGAAQFALPPAAVSSATLATMQKARCTIFVTDLASLTIGGLRKVSTEEDWLADGGSASPAAVRSGDGDLPCLVTTSSGTTAEPKLIAVTHRQFHHRMTCAGPMGFDDQDQLLSLLDLGIFVQRSVVLRALMSGATVHLAPLQSAPDIVGYCNRNRITSLFALPFMVSTWLRTVAADADIRLVHVRKLVLAGSTVTRQEFEAAVDRLTPNIFVAYGSNELGTVSFADPEMRRRFPLSIGRLVEGAKAEIVDDADRPLGAGEVGLIRIRAQGMIAGYPDQQGLNDYHFRAGWFYPGDLASRTDEGVLLFHGRADDMMIFNGTNIYPSEIEAALQDHPAVLEAAAFPWRSAVHQDIPVAAVVLKAASDERELVGFCRQSLGMRAPRRIFLVDRLPRNAMGKVVKQRLAEAIGNAIGSPTDDAAPE